MSAEQVLSTASTVSCGHGGTVAVQGTAALTVAGAPVLVQAGIGGKPVAQCRTQPKSDASGPIDVPCTSVAAVTAGQATKLTVGGVPVVLESLAGGTNGLVAKQPQQKVGGDAGQTKLRSA
jgi:hypothetical protein